MLNNKISERERLLKLIDGGPEAMKEIEKKQIENLDKARMAAVFSFIKEKISWMFRKLRPVPLAEAKPKKTSVLIILAAVAVLLAAVYFVVVLRKHPVLSSPAEVIAHSTDKNPSTSEMTHLKLVGVDWSDQPVALIEDTRTGKTYFAKKNDTVNDAKVKQVLKDRVIVQVRHQTLELRS